MIGSRSKKLAVALGLAIVAMLPVVKPAAAEPLKRGDPASEKRARDLIKPHLAKLASDAGAQASDLVETGLDIDDLLMAHERVQQHHQGVPVFGGEAIVHLDKDGKLAAVTDDLKPGVHVGSVKPALSPAKAIEAALDLTGSRGRATADPTADLEILRHDGEDRLVYRVRIERLNGTADTAIPTVFIDARSGEEVWRYDDLQTGTGPSLYSGTVTVQTVLNNSTFYMEDVSRKMGTFDYRNTTTSTYRMSDSNDVWDTASQKAALDAHYGAAAFYDYLKNTHGRNGIDGNSGPGYYTSIDGVTPLVTSRVHYSTGYNNAFWNGQYITYGDGDGSTFTSLVTLDIVGHEMTHGVIERTAKLTYSGESGALNESWADVFGAMTEASKQGESANTWMIGEQAYTPANGTGDALRYFDDPHKASNSGFTTNDDPDHYSERYTGTSDNGGVHTNSGIANKAFFLLAKGGSHHLGGSMTGITKESAARIWYRALTTYMTSSTNFAGARTATISAANDLFGSASTQAAAVATAWCLVGVGTCGGTTPPPSGTELISNGGFEGTASPWTLTGNGALYTNVGNYSHGGTGYSYFGSLNSATGQMYQTVAIPSTAAGNLTFWLNVSSAETTTTTQFDKLFVEVRNTAGTLLATSGTYSNLNKVATAGSYTQKTLSLAAYKGQTVRIQFRTTTDSTLITTFRVDDVMLS